MFFTDEIIFFYDSLPQGFINNTILGNNVYDAFPPVRTPFIVSLSYFENIIPDFLLELEQPKIEQLAPIIAI